MDRYNLITKNLQEIIGQDQLKTLIKSKKKISLYWGTMPTGSPHFAYFLPLLKIKDFLKAKIEITILIADFHAALDGIDELKKMIFERMSVIRVYTQEPGKKPGKLPMVMPEKSTVRDVAEKILKGFSRQIKETRLTGPSAKFMNQKVGLTHVLKDRDIIEFHTR